MKKIWIPSVRTLKACYDLSLTDGHDQSFLGMANVDLRVTYEQVIRIIHDRVYRHHHRYWEGSMGCCLHSLPPGSLAMFGPFGQVRMISAFTPGMLLKLGGCPSWFSLWSVSVASVGRVFKVFGFVALMFFPMLLFAVDHLQ
ncbi:hypothetical protein V6N13_131158 [Hibiscus sabdariffa]